MADHNENPPEHGESPSEGAAAPGGRTTPAAPGDRPVAPASQEAASHESAPQGSEPYAAGGAGTESPRGGPIEGGPGTAGRTGRPDRFRRWSASAPVRMGALALVAGLVGGLVGGGVVAAFNDDGHDGIQKVRFERGVPRGGPGWGRPRYMVPYGGWVRPDQPVPPGQPVPRDQPGQPGQPEQSAAPSPRATG